VYELLGTAFRACVPLFIAPRYSDF
jgi:hypothetical protein